MDILEIINDDLDIKKVEMTCDKIIKDNNGVSVSEPLMKTSFCYLICGSPGSGKTNLLCNLVSKRSKSKNGFKKSYYKMFDNVLFVSPSKGTIKNSPFEDLDEEKIFDDITPEVFEKIDDITEEGVENDEHTLLILDDVSSRLKDKDVLRDLTRLIKNRRHKNLSIIIIGHKLTNFPLDIRVNCSLIFLFRQSNKTELERIRDELTPFDKNNFKDFINFVYKNKHDFLLIDQSLRRHAKVDFYRNFNLLEINF